LTLGERVREVRKSQVPKLSQTEFAVQLGLTRAQVKTYELDVVETPESTVRLICMKFGIAYDWLKTGEGDMRISSQDADVGALVNIMTGDNEFAKNLFRAYARLGTEEWERLRLFMEDVIRQTQADEKIKK